MRRRLSSSTGGEESDQYGLSQLFQPDNVQKGALLSDEAIKEEDSTVRTKFKVALKAVDM